MTGNQNNQYKKKPKSIESVLLLFFKSHIEDFTVHSLLLTPMDHRIEVKYIPVRDSADGLTPNGFDLPFMNP